MLPDCVVVTLLSVNHQLKSMLLLLMYKNSRDVTLHKVFPRNTRGSARILFKTANFEGALYKQSPYFVGSKLWNSMSSSDIELPDIFAFKSRLKRLNRTFLDLLS